MVVEVDSDARSVHGRMMHADFIAERRFGSLDGLRAVSILAVIWHHTGASAFSSGVLRYAGPEGVTLFFAISGFLITSLLLRERDRNGFIDLQAFYLRRALRIFPLYYGVLLIYLVLSLLLERHSAPGQQFFRNFFYFLTYTSNWFVVLDGRVIFYFAWSLAAEEQFYVLWPALLRSTRTASLALLLLAMGTLVLGSVELLGSPRFGLAAGLTWFATHVPWAIVFGAMAALTLHSPSGFAAMTPFVAGRAASLVWLVLVALALSTPETPRIVLHGVLTAFVIACVVNRRHWLASVLAWRPLAYLGTISYGMYLLHMLVKNAVVKLLSKLAGEPDWFVVFALTTALVIVAAGLSFRYFESYFLTRKQRFER